MLVRRRKKRKIRSVAEKEFERRLRLKTYEKKYIVGRVTSVSYVYETFREYVSELDFSEEERAYISDNIKVGKNFLFVRGKEGVTAVLRWVLRLNTVTLSDLEDRAREYARVYWGREFDIPIEVVKGYWKRQLGAYKYKVSGEPVSISLSEKTMYGMTEKAIYETLLHEMVHWHLHTSGLPYRDADRGFILECRRVGASLSGAKYAKDAIKRVDRGSGI